ncbi:16299_t:CDS:1 [Dentiscutata erythropus]|uniref:16299_t:CDS:1 n=1 Tax=Dentiscutata erythropus TaxID=1348616 RepID=A0A9N8ZTX8_9GLOM|nr:16299_t:CDS:1 [Dentiscutata erythropus]
MAKGLRSKIKRRFRAIKRKTVFAPVEDARTFRLSSKPSQATGGSIRPKQQLNETTSSTSFTVETSQHDPQLQLTSEINSSGCIMPTNILETMQDVSGSLCYEILGFLNPDFVDITNLAGLVHVFSDLLEESF